MTGIWAQGVCLPHGQCQGLDGVAAADRSVSISEVISAEAVSSVSGRVRAEAAEAVVHEDAEEEPIVVNKPATVDLQEPCRETFASGGV